MTAVVTSLDLTEISALRQDPGGLFAYLWQLVVPHEQTACNFPWHGAVAIECSRLAQAILTASGPDLPGELLDYLGGGGSGAEDVPAGRPLERALVVMCALDDAAGHIHPQTATLHGPGRVLQRPGQMLRNLEVQRIAEGHFGARKGVGIVVPKGPLNRPRSMEEGSSASGDRLDRWFTYLSVIPALPLPYTLNLDCVGPADYHGGPLADGWRVGMAPLAQDGDDLIFRTTKRRGLCFLHAEPADPAVIAERAAEAVCRLLDENARLIVLPELCVPPEAVDAVQQRLRDRARRARVGTPGLLVLGSGVSRELCPDSKRPYNECVVMDAGGRVLWRQRKTNHFNMGAHRMQQCRLPSAMTGASHLEDIATHPALLVRDLPDLGRVVILICEDLEQQVPGDTVFKLRPDLIVTPALDIAQSPGRWTHQRAMEIARRTGARVVVADSTTLAVRFERCDRFEDVPSDKAALGFCLDGLGERHSTLIVPTAPIGDVVAVAFEWAPSTWSDTKISLAAPSAKRAP